MLHRAGSRYALRKKRSELPKERLALVGGLAGSQPVWETLKEAIKKDGTEEIYCLGGLTDPRGDNHSVLKSLRLSKKVMAIVSEQDWAMTQELQKREYGLLADEDREYLLSLPQVLSFQIGEKQGAAFCGRYLQDLPGYSDYEPFALEMNMVANLTQFMEDTSVFPALEAMTPQFQAQVVLFGQRARWGHWQPEVRFVVP